MSRKVDELIQQFIVLSSSEKQELMTKISRGQSGVGQESRGGVFGESTGATTINFAPTPGTCPRCGK